MTWNLETLSPKALRNWTDPRSWQRGVDYARQGRVSLVYFSEDEAAFQARGFQGRIYEINLRAMPDGLLYRCTCPVGSHGLLCKHCVAAALTLLHHLQQEQAWQHRLKTLDNWTPRRAPQSRAYLLLFILFPTPFMTDTSYTTLLPFWVPLKEVQQKLDLPAPDENPAAWPQTPAAWRAWVIEQRVVLAALGRVRAPGGGTPVRIVNLPPAAEPLSRLLTPDDYFGYANQIPNSTMVAALEALARWQAPLFLSRTVEHPFPHIPLTITETVLQPELVLQRQGNELVLQLTVPGEEGPLVIQKAQALTSTPVWALLNGQLVAPLALNDARWLGAFASPVRIPADEEATFREHYLPTMMRTWSRPLQGNVIRYRQVQGQAPRPRLYLQEDDDTLVAELRFAYGDDVEVPYQPAPPPFTTRTSPTDPWEFITIQRDADAEVAWHKQIASAKFGLKRGSSEHPERLQLRARVSPVDFLLDKVPALAEAGVEIFGEEKLTKLRVRRETPRLSVRISSGIDWFDVQALVQFGDQTVPLAEIKRALRRKRRYVKLADGSIGRLPDEWLQRYQRLLGLAIKTDDAHDTLRFAAFHAGLLEALTAEAAQVEADKDFRARLARLKNFRGLTEHPLPQGLRGELRPYQRAGYQWLHFLHDYGFGGILADDMGLGKTVQVLAFLLSLREQGHPQAADLIVVPRSLLANWQREVEKFTPTLKVLAYFGPQRPPVEAFDQYDLVLTTYGTMRRDIQKLQGYRFHYAILDESQAIKNPAAQTARAARSLRSEHRLAMTGTPVENNTLELWAQFAFVMPGLLGSLERFKDAFLKPIEQHRNPEAIQQLRRLVYPFILRRTKAQVAPELPPRVERMLYCPMEPEQRRFYHQLRDYYRQLLLNLLETEGLHKSRMKILEGLLRLRQASIHPRLVDPEFRGLAGKMEVLLTTLETLREEGHKALVFSQFVEVLRMVRRELDARGVPYAYLDGSTRDRQAQVDRFQNDPRVPFFLISLKAGGVGLNLTAADYVIHIDPWWNPAVEQQATDRAHRIGQDKPVFIYKLITRDSIEEKILQLQERKRALVEQLVTAEGRFFKELTPEDIQALFG